MDINELRALQTPLKERYKQNPESAIIATRAEDISEIEDIVCRIPNSVGTTVAGLHPVTGGDGSKACSAYMLMESLVACAGVTLKAVATAMRIPLKRAKVIAEGNWDARGTLGVDRDAPVGLRGVRLTFKIDSSANPEKIEKLVQLTERFCVIYQTLANPPKLTSHYSSLTQVCPRVGGTWINHPVRTFEKNNLGIEQLPVKSPSSFKTLP